MMDKTIERPPSYMPLTQWFAIVGGFLAVAIPWWIGLLWMLGVLH